MKTKKPATKETKRFISDSEIKMIGNHYNSLRRKLYSMIESDKLNSVAKAEIKSFYKGLEKARDNFNIYRATNFKHGSFH